ncbi:NmrA family NAD(P)-binding protein [Mucilaginibacter defluvii]|uniref:NmrA-like domain-containing protein n=1 Tax=Mucilaginibacter defluvii TaxID=1196019 RepID=A0ABP9G0W6_9SPHI
MGRGSGCWSVTALTRDPDTDAAEALAASGAEVVQADLSDMASLRNACDGVFAVTQPRSYERGGL